MGNYRSLLSHLTHLSQEVTLAAILGSEVEGGGDRAQAQSLRSIAREGGMDERADEASRLKRAA